MTKVTAYHMPYIGSY